MNADDGNYVTIACRLTLSALSFQPMRTAPRGPGGARVRGACSGDTLRVTAGASCWSRWRGRSRTAGALGGVDSGTFAVGYRVLLRYDRARPPVPNDSGVVPAGAAGRQMAVSVWYPARQVSGARRMSVTDYVARNAQALDFGRSMRGAAPRASPPSSPSARAAKRSRAIARAARGEARGGERCAGCGRALPARRVRTRQAGESRVSGRVMASSSPACRPKGKSEPAYRLNAGNLETMVADAAT